MNVMTAALRDRRSVSFHKSVLPAAIAVEHRNVKFPPKLPGSIPVVETLHPSEAGLSPTLWDGRQPDRPLTACAAGSLAYQRQQTTAQGAMARCRAAAVAMHNGVIKIFNVIKQAMLKPRTIAPRARSLSRPENSL